MAPMNVMTSLPPVAFNLVGSSVPTANSALTPPPGPVIQRGGNSVKIVSGDTLWEISIRVYGHHRYIDQIRAANPGKNMIVGQTYHLPQIEIPISTAIKDQSNKPKGLRDLLVSIPQANYDAYRASLSQSDIEAQGQSIQKLDLIRNTGITMDEMADTQKKFMEDQAASQGVSVGEYIAGDIQERGYGGSEASFWNSLLPAEQEAFAKRFEAIVKRIENEAPPKVKAVIEASKAKNGGFVWAPKSVEENDALAYTIEGGWSLYAGVEFVRAAENDISSVFPNIVHEMGGHNEYGDSLGDVVFSGALSKLPQPEQNKATAGGNSPSSAFGYMETEIWAELREDELDSNASRSDSPFGRASSTYSDVEFQLEGIRNAFAKPIADGLVRSIYQRASTDSRITKESLARFKAAIKKVLEIEVE